MPQKLERPPSQWIFSAATTKSRSVAGPRSVFAPGDTLGDFVVVDRLGSGSFADVYLAREVALDRLVALKISNESNAEARIIAGLEHDHIVRIHSKTHLPGSPLIVIAMQYVEGGSLTDVLTLLRTTSDPAPKGRQFLEFGETKQPLSSLEIEHRAKVLSFSLLEWTLFLGEQICHALSFAHKKGILHLDVKPANILIASSGRAFLTDFNVAWDRRLPPEEAIKTLGGTRVYMAPEHAALFTSDDRLQALADLGPTADIYSLGCVLKDLLAGRETPAPVKALLDCATSPDPEARFSSADKFADALGGAREMLRRQTTLPPMDLVQRSSLRHPLWGLTLWGALPQTVSSVMGTIYNTHITFGHIHPQGLATFQSLNSTVVPAVFGSLTLLWAYAIYRTNQATGNLRQNVRHESERRSARKIVLSIPWVGIAVSTLGWLACALIYPWSLARAGHPLGPEAAYHLTASFLIAGIISVGYSCLIHWSLVLRHLYLAACLGEASIQHVSQQDLRWVPRMAQVCAYLTALVPLLSAATALTWAPRGDTESLQLFQTVAIAFIGTSIAGLFAAIGLSQRVAALSESLTRPID